MSPRQDGGLALAEIPGFEILSRISERETKRFVRDFLLLQEVIEVIMPGLTRGHVAVPTALILCGGRGKGFDEFLPAEQSDERYGTNSLFFRDPERAAIVIDFALSELRVDADTVDRMYMDKVYFLGPDKGGDRAFTLLGSHLMSPTLPNQVPEGCCLKLPGTRNSKLLRAPKRRSMVSWWVMPCRPNLVTV